MGMSSSQARLLTLTARMHDIEYKAQRIEAQKLQMANESRRVYEQYLDALDAKKIQYKGINSDGSITFRDASLRALENGAIPDYDGECSYKPFLLKNGMTDEIYITPEFADYYGIDPDNMEPLGTLDDYLRKNNVPEVPVMKPIYGEDYTKVLTATPVENIKTQDFEPEKPATPPEYNINQNIGNVDLSDIYNTVTGSIGRATVGESIVEERIPQKVITYNQNTCSVDINSETVNLSVPKLANNLRYLFAIAAQEPCSHFSQASCESFINNFANYLCGAGSGASDIQYFAAVIEKAMSDSKSGNNQSIENVYNYLKDFYLGTKNYSAFNLTDFLDCVGYNGGSIPISMSNSWSNIGGSQGSVLTQDTRNYIRTDVTSIRFDCTQNDVNAIVAQAMIDKGYWSGHVDDYLEDMNLGSKMDYAIIAYYANKKDDNWAHILEDLRDENLNTTNYSPQNWDSISPDSYDSVIHFSTGEDTLGRKSNIDYDYTAHDIAAQIANSIYESDNTIEPTEELINSILSGINSNNTMNDNAWVSIASCFGTGDWNSIVNKIKAGDYDLNDYTDKIPSDVTAHLGNTNKINITGEGGAPAVPGQIEMWEVPSLQSIASNLLVAFRKKGYDVDNSMETIILQKLQAVYSNLGSLSQNGYMAVINEAICRFLSNSSNSNIVEDLYNYVQGTADAPIISLSSFGYPLGYEHYTMSSDTTARCEATYGQKVIGEEPTGEMTWDVNSEEYKEYSQKYYVLKSMEGSKYKIIEDEELLNSSEFVANWLTLNEGYLLEFDPKTQEMVDTNVAVNTNLQEVSDEKDLKKAEAKYEADMKRIDMKDRRYDTQLAALDNERNAVKQEMETVKTVAKDNVDRTFRLFS